MMARWRREQRQVDAPSIERLFRALFENRGPTIKEATAIAVALRGDTVTPATFDSLGRPLLDDAELRRPSDERHALASALVQLRCAGRAPVTTAASSLICLLAHMHDQPALLRPAQIWEIERHLRWLPDAFLAPTVTLVAAVVLEACQKEAPETHRACFAAGVSAFGEASFQALVLFAFLKIVGKSAAQRSDRAERLVASLFTAWAPGHRRTPTSASSFFMRDLLPQAIPVDDRLVDSVRTALNGVRTPVGAGKGEPLWPLWEDWVAQNRPSLLQRILG